MASRAASCGAGRGERTKAEAHVDDVILGPGLAALWQQLCKPVDFVCSPLGASNSAQLLIILISIIVAVRMLTHDAENRVIL